LTVLDILVSAIVRVVSPEKITPDRFWSERAMKEGERGDRNVADSVYTVLAIGRCRYTSTSPRFSTEQFEALSAKTPSFIHHCSFSR
jgi:hypothetical protein